MRARASLLDLLFRVANEWKTRYVAWILAWSLVTYVTRSKARTMRRSSICRKSEYLVCIFTDFSFVATVWEFVQVGFGQLVLMRIFSFSLVICILCKKKDVILSTRWFEVSLIDQTACYFYNTRWPAQWIRSLYKPWEDSNLVDSASSHTLVSKIKPCMSKYKSFTLKLRTAHYISYSLFDSPLLLG